MSGASHADGDRTGGVGEVEKVFTPVIFPINIYIIPYLKSSRKAQQTQNESV